MQKRFSIHIFHISDFGGHSQAAQNIKEAVLSRQKNAEVINLNSFNYFYPRIEKVVDFVYTLIIKKVPSLWGKAYDRKALAKCLIPWRKVINFFCFRKLNKYIREKNPDCFIATQAFPCGLIADYKKKSKSGIPLVAVVTDFHPHRFWVHSFVDRYVVASEEAKRTLVSRGLSPEIVNVLGIPVSVKFMKAYPKEAVAGRFGFRKDLKAVLVMGGGLGIGPIEKIVSRLGNINFDFQIIVICGKNRFLYRRLVKQKKRIRKPLFIFSYIGYVNEIMDFSDIIITKAGGITTSEALAKKLAIVTINPIPGQEKFNVDHLVKRDSIIQAKSITNLAQILEHLLANPQALRKMQENAEKNSFADSSLRIADLILGLTSSFARPGLEKK